MMTASPSLPEPQVIFLPTLLREIEAGAIRVPAFQRKFVWEEKNIVDLFDSVFRGYPIGSLLFWRTAATELRADTANTAFPDVPTTTPVRFILDGQQRLSALYGCLTWKDETTENKFNLWFDLDRKNFFHFDPSDDLTRAISLASLLSPKLLMQNQRRLGELEGGDNLLEASVFLHSAFQQYAVPAVTIVDKQVSEVVEIFERINRTGEKLGAVDFMRAVNWSTDFDLSLAIGDIATRCEDLGFLVPEETIAKVIAMALGREPLSDQIVTMKRETASSLKSAAKCAEDALVEATGFFKSLGIRSYDFVPYEGQTLMVAKLFLDGASEPAEKAVRQWFWTVSFSEGLRGKPDHYVARAIHSLSDVRAGSATSLGWRSTLTPELLVERSFVRGGALSGAVASLLAMNGARSLSTGEEIPPEVFTVEFSTEHFEPLLEKAEVQLAVGRKVRSARVLANTIVCTEAERRVLRGLRGAEKLEMLRAAAGAGLQRNLDSQLISPQALARLEAGDHSGFLELRAMALTERAEQLIRA